MLILIAIIMLNVWAIPADDLFSPNINILEELGKIKIMETRMESMEKQMEQLRTENRAQAKKLEETKIKMDELIKENEAQAKKLDDTKIKMDELIKENDVSKVAFSVSLSSSNGPHSRPRTLIYKHIFLNTGDAYNSNTGIFTAPMKGVYAFKVFSKTYGSQDDKGVSAGLFRNSQHVISTYVHQKSGFIGSSNGVSLLLEKGDKIYVILYRTFSIFDNEYHHSTFSGHLLFPM
ncbi:cerebellin 10 isoform X3 [Labeo rohita]|uniref:cerebellin 10 isoform X3 n=1 Tax=Labeo rohita TaxID=84645 RepID=UPI0021E272EA|nr:cerebellin 10 isoform X3 [Labeo rohita]